MLVSLLFFISCFSTHFIWPMVFVSLSTDVVNTPLKKCLFFICLTISYCCRRFYLVANFAVLRILLLIISLLLGITFCLGKLLLAL